MWSLVNYLNFLQNIKFTTKVRNQKNGPHCFTVTVEVNIRKKHCITYKYDTKGHQM